MQDAGYQTNGINSNLLYFALGLNEERDATYSDVLFWIHMVQHLILTLVAPPLIKTFFAEDKDGDGAPDEMPDVDISDSFSRIG